LSTGKEFPLERKKVVGLGEVKVHQADRFNNLHWEKRQERGMGRDKREVGEGYGRTIFVLRKLGGGGKRLGILRGDRWEDHYVRVSRVWFILAWYEVKRGKKFRPEKKG